MLRTIVLIAGCLLLALGAGLSLFAFLPPGLYCLGLGALILIGTLFERRYRPAQPAEPSWQPTGERFVDPGSGKDVEVFYDPKSGARRYEQR